MSAETTTEETQQGHDFNPNTTFGTLVVALVLCLVCSLVVSVSAVSLKPLQEQNQKNKMRRNVLIAAGIWDPEKHTDADIEELFERVQPVVVNLPSPNESDPPGGTINEEIDPAKFDARKVAGDPSQSIGLTPVDDQAGIKRRAKMAMAYLVRGEDGKVQSIVLPIYGKGLWSTLYGFIALEGDAKTVRGITYYEHGETPGLGGEVDNPAWKAQWPGKVIVDDQGEPILNVTKPGNASAENEVDGLSGATITSNGVENMVQYWLGDNAFGPFLKRYREGELAIQQSK